MKTFRQAYAIALINLRSLVYRKGASAVLVFGIAGVVLVLVSLLSMARGLEATLKKSGRDDRVLMLRTGSNSELNGSITREQLRILVDQPGMAKNSQQKAIIAGEIYTSMFLPRNSGRRGANMPLRGVSAESFEVRPEVKIIQGRNIEFGKFEMIIGRRAAAEFSGVAVGDAVSVRGITWRIVGQFAAAESAFESEAWADGLVIGEAFKRGPYLSSVSAILSTTADIETLREAIVKDPRLPIQVMRESDYYSRQASSSTGVIRLLGMIIGGIMAVGAIFSALNTMYAAVASRTGEIATLKALGFQSVPIISSVIVESTVLALVGGAIGAAAAWLLFDGFTASTVGATFSQVAFKFAVTTKLVAVGVTLALLLGLIGGLFPAMRAARMPVLDGLKGLR